MAPLEAAIAIIRNDDRILITQRPPENIFAGMWEFPGGKRESGETIEQCLSREVVEELGITIKIVERLSQIEHHYPHGHIRLIPFVCCIIDGTPKPLASQEIRWVFPLDLRNFPFPPANHTLIEEVIAFCQKHRTLAAPSDQKS